MAGCPAVIAGSALALILNMNEFARVSTRGSPVVCVQGKTCLSLPPRLLSIRPSKLSDGISRQPKRGNVQLRGGGEVPSTSRMRSMAPALYI